ncbi:MAG: hypothetical protein K8H88_16135, partial [Sandaracinaceae bacterium]|nr:hypothetical protein [Sandaracinaceae bacterium]
MTLDAATALSDWTRNGRANAPAPLGWLDDGWQMLAAAGDRERMSELWRSFQTNLAAAMQRPGEVEALAAALEARTGVEDLRLCAI